MKKNNDKARLIITSVVVGLVILTFLILITTVLEKGNIEAAIIPGIITIVIAVFAIKFIKSNYSSVKKGMPIRDERSNKIIKQAGYYAFMVSLYWILALSWLSESIPFRDINQAMNFGVLGMAVIFGISWVIINKWGKF